MNKTVKIIFAIIGVLIVVLVGAAIIATQLFDADKIKQVASEQALANTGRTLEISGDIEITYFPWLGVDLGHTSLSNPAGFGDKPMVEVERVSASIKIMPLLSGQIELNTVTLKGFSATLHTKADGSSNFADLTGKSAGDNQAAPSAPQSQPETSASAGDKTGLPDSFSLGGIAITDGQFHLIDETSQTNLKVTGLKITTGAIAPGQPVDLKIKATADLAEPELHAELSISGRLSLGDQMKQISLTDLSIGLTASGEEIPGQSLQLTFAADLSADLVGDQLSVEEISLSLAELQLGGSLTVNKMSSDPQVAAAITLKQFNANTLLSSLGLPAIETSDPQALTAVSANLTIAATNSQLTIEPININLDQTLISGNTTITNFDNPAISFKLAIDSIDADRYLPASDVQETTDNQPTAPAGSGESAEPLHLGESLAALAALNLDGSLTVGELKVSNLRSSNIVVTINAKAGRLQLNPLSADLYEGKFQGNVDINGAKQPPTISVSQKLTGVALAPLVTDLAAITPISGTAKITATLSTQGNSAEELTRGLNGKLGFDITDGTLKEINIDRSVCLAKQGLNALKGSGSSEACPPDQPTRFTFFLANATVTAGVLKNDDLFIEQARSDSEKFMHIKGSGSADLNREKINYRVTASQVRKLAQGGYETRGTPIPVMISGSFTDPSVKPDVSGLIQTQLKSKLQQKLEQQLEKKSDAGEPESAKDQLKNQLLRGLFN